MPDSSLPRGATAPSQPSAKLVARMRRVASIFRHPVSAPFVKSYGGDDYANWASLLDEAAKALEAADGEVAALLAAPVEAPPVVPVERTVRTPADLIDALGPYSVACAHCQGRSLGGELVCRVCGGYGRIAVSAPSVSPASVQAPDEAPPPQWRERLIEMRQEMRRVVEQPDDKDAQSAWTWRLDMWADEIDTLLSVPSAAAPREGHGLLEPLKAACDRSWSDETPEQIVAIAANALYWRDQEIARLKAALADAPQAQACRIDPVSSRGCERGTRGCIVEHAAQAHDTNKEK